tara:strand:- start:1551 stop:2615 length:1065 start_codon:yes stop_codon:yes gene_type:complete
MLNNIFINSYYFLKENILYIQKNIYNNTNNINGVNNTNNLKNINNDTKYNSEKHNIEKYSISNIRTRNLLFINITDTNTNTNDTDDIILNILSAIFFLTSIFLILYLCNKYCNHMICFRRRTLYINYNTLNNLETENINNDEYNTNTDNIINIDSITETLNSQYNYINTNYVSNSITDLSEMEFLTHNIENLKNNINKMFINNEIIQKKILQYELYYLHTNKIKTYSYLQKIINNNENINADENNNINNNLNHNEIIQEYTLIEKLPEEYLNTEDVCSICLDEYKNNDILHLECNHLYHEQCFLEWVIKQKYDIINILNTQTNNINFDDVHIFCPECKKKYPKIKKIYSRYIDS